MAKPTNQLKTMFYSDTYAKKSAAAAATKFGIKFDTSWTVEDIKYSTDACESYAIEDEYEAALFMNAFG